MKSLRAFSCKNVGGIYLPAVAIVFAYDETQALALMEAVIDENHLRDQNTNPLALTDLSEIELRARAEILWNGDY